MAKFELYTGKDGQFYFRLRSDSGNIMGTGEGYKAKPSAKNGIESVKKNASVDSRYELKEGSSGKWHFNLKASNGQVILTSAKYDSEDAAKSGIIDVKTTAPNADVHDET